MCEPTTMMFAASAAIGAAGSIQQGSASASAARTNAAQLEVQAQRRLMKAEFDIQETGHAFDLQQGALRNRISLTGLTAGSFSDLLASDATERALQVESIKWSANNDASNLRAQAEGERSRASDAVTAGYFNAAGAVVRAGSGYYQSAGLGKRGTSLDTGFAIDRHTTYGPWQD